MNKVLQIYLVGLACNIILLWWAGYYKYVSQELIGKTKDGVKRVTYRLTAGIVTALSWVMIIYLGYTIIFKNPRGGR